MLTGSALATGIAAPSPANAVGEQLRRAASRKAQGDGRSHMRFSRRTARGCIPRCVYLRQRSRGLERPWLKTCAHGSKSFPKPTATPLIRIAESCLMPELHMGWLPGGPS
eukprot:3507776-Prymnesium_polylepis.1